MTQPVITFVTIVTGPYWPGFAALVESISRNSGLGCDEYRYIVYGEVPSPVRQWMDKRQEAMEVRSIEALGRIPVLSEQLQGKRMEEALQKLLIFKITDLPDPTIYLDADMICLSSLEGIRAFTPLTAGRDKFSGNGAAGFREVNVNTGFLVFRPDPALFDRLLATYQAAPERFQNLGDQDVFNAVVPPSEITQLTNEWNFLKRYQGIVGLEGVRQRIPQIRFLHFVGYKPWWPNQAVPYHECRYFHLESLWWEQFRTSGLGSDEAVRNGLKMAWQRQYLLPWITPGHFLPRLKFLKQRLKVRIKRILGR